jgi:hypothetical protein
MKIKKIILTIVAWIGLLAILVGTYPAFMLSISSFHVGPGDDPPWLGMGYFGLLMTIIMGSLGTFLALVGGISSRPRYFWGGLVAAGVIYMTSFFGLFVFNYNHYNEISLGEAEKLIPGIVCISGGVFIKYLRECYDF